MEKVDYGKLFVLLHGFNLVLFGAASQLKCKVLSGKSPNSACKHAYAASSIQIVLKTLKRLGGAVFIGSSIVVYISIIFSRLKHCEKLICEPWSFLGIPLVIGLTIYLLFGLIDFFQKGASLLQAERLESKRAADSIERRIKFIGGVTFILSLFGTIAIFYFSLPVTFFTQALVMMGFGGIFLGSSLFVLGSILK